MGKTDIKACVCRPFCMFFKEGQKEDFICGGAHVIERFLTLKKLCSETLPEQGEHPSLRQGHRDILDRWVCRFCPFRKEDCDFASSAPPVDAEPCGGYILLSLLIETGRITSSDLEEIAFE